jgi:hypothetical protein
MKTIEYRVQYTGAVEHQAQRGRFYSDGSHPVEVEVVRVQARDINSGFGKALKLAQEPLGSGFRREIGGIEFWQIV